MLVSKMKMEVEAVYVAWRQRDKELISVLQCE